MAKINIRFETDGEAVWFWELCKKLGYKVEVCFGNVTDVLVGDVAIHGDACSEQEGCKRCTKTDGK